MSGGLPPIAPPDAPTSPGWWPLPPGWWFVVIGVILLVIWVSGRRHERRLRRRRDYRPAPAVRDLALAALDELEARESVSDRQMAYRINEILRAALFVSGPSDRWACFSPRPGIVSEREEWEEFWEELALRYRRPDGGCDIGRQRHWLRLTRGWIEKLPVEDGGEQSWQL